MRRGSYSRLPETVVVSNCAGGDGRHRSTATKPHWGRRPKGAPASAPFAGPAPTPAAVRRAIRFCR